MGNDVVIRRKELLEEVLIKPARSVLLVDDEYPTLDKMLSGYIDDGDVWSKSKAKAKDNAKRVSDIISYCRAPERNWHVDVHDGENVSFKREAETAQNLHQSDLLFLDFHLDGDGNDPDKCLEILQHLADSDHFNLVVIVTKEDVQQTFNKVILKFLKPRFAKALDGELFGKVDTEIRDWSEDEETPFRTRLIESVSLDALLRLPSVENLVYDSEEVISLLGGLTAILDKAPDDMDRNNALKWALRIAEQEFSAKGSAEIEHSSLNSDQKWVCARNLFVTVVAKTEIDQGQQIIDGLTNALVVWNPTANRLMLIKLRSEIEARGLSIGADLFAKKSMQALWLHGLITADEERRLSDIDETVRRHGEALISLVAPSIRETIMKSLGMEEVVDADDRILDSFGVDLRLPAVKEQAVLEHNIAVSNCDVRGWHLEPGHIFKYRGDHWLVLTPVCDLVPAQRRKRAAHLPGLMPFNAVKFRLLTQNTKNILAKADHNLTTFVETETDPASLHFLTQDSSNSEVHWNEFFAKNRGKLGDANSIVIATAESEDGESLKFEWESTEICRQLRYEYAINLMQILGARSARIGLNFKKPN